MSQLSQVVQVGNVQSVVEHDFWWSFDGWLQGGWSYKIEDEPRINPHSYPYVKDNCLFWSGFKHLLLFTCSCPTMKDCIPFHFLEKSCFASDHLLFVPQSDTVLASASPAAAPWNRKWGKTGKEISLAAVWNMNEKEASLLISMSLPVG